MFINYMLLVVPQPKLVACFLFSLSRRFNFCYGLLVIILAV